MAASETFVSVRNEFASAPLVQEIVPQTPPVFTIQHTFTALISQSPECTRFTGKPVSQTTGLYYDYQRWYDPSIGRFISQDPLGGDPSSPQSLDRYVYVNNTPTTFADSTGLAMGVTLVTLHGSCPGIFQDFWGSLRCSIFGPGPAGAVTGGGQGGSGAWVGPGTGATEPTPAGVIIVGVIWAALGAYWLYSNWDELFGDRGGSPGGGGDSSNGGSGPWPVTTPSFTGKIGPTVTFLGVGGAVTEASQLSGLASSVPGAWKGSFSSFPANVRGGEMRGPFTGKGSVLRACVGPRLVGVGLGIWIASHPSKDQSYYGAYGAPFATGLLFYFGCVAFGNWVASVPH